MTDVNVQNGQQQQNGRFPPKLADEMPRNKLGVDLIGPYKIRRKGENPLILKAFTMIDPVTLWFEITQYNNKRAMNIANLVEMTWITRYPCPIEIMSD